MTGYSGLVCHLTLDFQRRGWYPEIVDELITRVRALPMWSRFTTLRGDDAQGEPLTDARLEAVARDARNRVWYVDAGDDSDVELRCFRDGPELLLRLQVLNDDFRRYARDLPAILVGFATGFGAPLVATPSGISTMFQPDLPREPLPQIPDSGGVRIDQIVDAFDRRNITVYADHPAGPAMRRLLASPPPEGVRQETHGDLALYIWPHDLADPDELARARALHRRWAVEQLGARAEPPAGDTPLHAGAQVASPPLSFLDDNHTRGFKTVLVLPDGTIDEASWAIAVAAATKQLPDLVDLKSIYVVVPLRNHAIALADRARRDGLSGVAYPANGDLWIPSQM